MALKDNYIVQNQADIPAPFNKLIPEYFQAWDNPHSKDEEWIKFFSPNGVTKFGGHVLQGYDALRAMRAGFIDPVEGPVVQCKHTLKTCWMLAGGSEKDTYSFLFKSSIWYRLVNGQKIDAECVSYMKMVETGKDEWRAIEYEVFMSSFEVFDAIKAMVATQSTK
ncbi:hypothetical protein B0A52_07447 [Exophiala mesophila]|uniref:SnoaL-like domain-containing protein n=1 Tax=Exophiala mesophila TaxID=212818 RepID=A0A438MXM1_EXOME|nr:hypothetical protein B0A52_07447 [Exophiala mesophila]